jgi:hypothetical protein
MHRTALLVLLVLTTGAAAEDLTPLGAERAGNAAGTIPAWDGGLTHPPPGWDPARHHLDPFAADTMLFTIDASNLAQHAERLTDGQRALFAAFPDYRMRVFPTRRTAAYPDFVYAALDRNAKSAEVVTEGAGGVRNARVTSPFPRPASGLEAIWNHILRWRGVRVDRSEGSAAVTAAGRFSLVLSAQELACPWCTAQPVRDHAFANVLLAAKSKVLLPSQFTGRGALAVETIEQTRDPRKVWRYLPAVRQVIRLPNFGYAMPALESDALRTVDDFELYIGPPDRYDWTLVGKEARYVPYNAYAVHADGLPPEAIVGPRHLAPERLRYELHRVWVVEARLKPDVRHLYGRRRFYLDEDSWQIVLADTWDLADTFIRTAEAHTIVYYDVPVPAATLYVFYDLKKHRFLVEGLDNERAPWAFSDTADPREFSPNALNYYVR